jgi:hypothetical protein
MQAKFSTEVVEISSHLKRTTVADKRSTVDQRSIPRLPLSYAVFLSRPGEAFGVVTKTENVSCKGFYCHSSRPFLPRETLDCQMVISGGGRSYSQANDLVLQAVVEVVRVMPWGMGRGFGMACRLDSYTIVPRSSLTASNFPSTSTSVDGISPHDRVPSHNDSRQRCNLP